VIRGHPPAVGDGRRLAEPDVRPGPGCETDVLPDDGWSTRDGDLFEPRLALPTADDIALALGSNVFHPLALSEHRHEILLALVWTAVPTGLAGWSQLGTASSALGHLGSDARRSV